MQELWSPAVNMAVIHKRQGDSAGADRTADTLMYPKGRAHISFHPLTSTQELGSRTARSTGWTTIDRGQPESRRVLPQIPAFPMKRVGH